jgi:hypothetical protein
LPGGKYGVSQPHCVGHDLVETLAIVGGKQIPVPELLHLGGKQLVDERFRPHQQRERDEESRVHIQVLKKWDAYTVRECSRDRGQYHQRQPGQESQRRDTSMQQLERRAGKSRSETELIKRSTEHQREVLRVTVSGACWHLDATFSAMGLSILSTGRRRQ